MANWKEIDWRGSSKDDLKALPAGAMSNLGYQLGRVQDGHNPDKWRPMASIGRGVREIIEQVDGNAYRCIYITSIGTKIYVLHVFQKKSEETSQADKTLAKKRLQDLMKELNDEKPRRNNRAK